MLCARCCRIRHAPPACCSTPPPAARSACPDRIPARPWYRRPRRASWIRRRVPLVYYRSPLGTTARRPRTDRGARQPSPPTQSRPDRTTPAAPWCPRHAAFRATARSPPWAYPRRALRSARAPSATGRRNGPAPRTAPAGVCPRACRPVTAPGGGTAQRSPARHTPRPGARTPGAGPASAGTSRSPRWRAAPRNGCSAGTRACRPPAAVPARAATSAAPPDRRRRTRTCTSSTRSSRSSRGSSRGRGRRR